MAVVTAPYNSAMRLGMGFNSFTQSLCVNDVVRKPGGIPASESDLRIMPAAPTTVTAAMPPTQATNGKPQHTPPGVLDGAAGTMSRKVVDGQKEVSQTVSWEAKFVQNSSEILKKLEISGALSIKLDGIGSVSGKGAFVDSSDMKTADINYFIHVKVVNQRLIADDITHFAPIPHVEPGQFPEIYGDCFISGFVEGGEFNALVTITTEDTLKKNNLSGSLELEAKIAAVNVSGKAEGKSDTDSKLNNSKTEIKVSWSGGGDIRDDKITEWNLQNLREIAMSFPDAVAACPQRISAILTKYTNLRSFHEATKKGSPLDYENAGVYTASLYDAYTDYKLLWKQIQQMTLKVNANEIQLYKQSSSPHLDQYASIMEVEQATKMEHYNELLEAQKAAQAEQALIPFRSRGDTAALEKPLPSNSIKLYEPDVFGLELAARDCRFEMIKIVREVDAVTKDPKVACDPYRVSQYLSPSIFRMLLPTPHEERMPTFEEWKNTKQDLESRKKIIEAHENKIAILKKTLEGALITPQRNESGNLLATSKNPSDILHDEIQKSLGELSYRAENYRMQSSFEDKNRITIGATFFNDLQTIKDFVRPKELRFWTKDQIIIGLCTIFEDSEQIAHGVREGNPQHVIMLAEDEAITEIEVYVGSSAEGKLLVAGINLATSKCNIMFAGKNSSENPFRFFMTEHSQWSFRGFFGFVSGYGFEDLAIVWGRDNGMVATNPIQPASSKNFLGMSSTLQRKVKAVMSESKPADHFYLGDFVSTQSPTTSAPTPFCALDDIGRSSKISRIAFSSSSGRLGGLSVIYDDGKRVIHGAFAQTNETWEADVRGPVVAVKLSVGRTLGAPLPFVDSIELVCGDSNGLLPDWPLDVLTVRYLGHHAAEEQVQVIAQLVEKAPKRNWTLRGFYGEEAQGLITKLGLIWGCD